MSTLRLNRRAMLRGLGAGIALPMLDAMLDSRGLLHGTALAAPTPPPVRLFTFFFPMGWGNLNPLGNFMNIVNSGPLAPYKNDMCLLTGLSRLGQLADDTSNRGDAHAQGHGTFATGYGLVPGGAGGPTVDQAAAQALGGTTAYRSLVLRIGGRPDNPPADYKEEAYFSNISWSARATPVPYENNPVRLFQRIFGSFTPPSPTGSPTPAPAPPNYRKNILDFVRADTKRLQARLGQADRARLDQHLTAIAELQQQINVIAQGQAATQAPGCQKPATPAGTLPELSNERAQALMSILSLALQCDLTRYGSMALATRPDQRQYPWIGVGGAGPEGEVGHHGLSHDTSAAGDATITKMVVDQCEQFAFFLKLLKAAPEGAGSVLDNSLIFFTSEHKTSAHDNVGGDQAWQNNNFAILAGRAGGKLTTGRTVNANGAPYGNTFVSMLNMAGVPTSSFGPHAPGAIPGL